MIKVAIFKDYENGRIEKFHSMNELATSYDLSDGDVRNLEITGELDLNGLTFQIQ